MGRKQKLFYVVSLIISALPVVALNVQPVSASTERFVCSAGLPAGCYGTIQLAIEGAAAGDVVVVPAGTYGIGSTITINKAITLRGPNAGVAGYGTRVAEAVLTGTTTLLSINAKVTIEGLEIHVDSTTPRDGITLLGGADQSVFRNNRLIGPNNTSDPRETRDAKPWNTYGIANRSNADDAVVEGNFFTGWVTGVWNEGTSGVRYVSNHFISNRSSMSGDNLKGETVYTGNRFVDNVSAISFLGGNGPFTIRDNYFQDNLVGPTFRALAHIAGLTFESNKLLNSPIRFHTATFGPVLLPSNWWGQATGPDTNASVNTSGGSGTIDAAPWCANESCTGSVTPVTGTTATIADPALGSPTFSWAEGAAKEGATVTVEPTTNPAPGATPFKTDGATLLEIEILNVAPPVTICVDGADPDRLWHFKSGAWKDITNDPAYSGGKVCGTVESFSPFAIAERGEEPPLLNSPLPIDDRAPGFDIDIDLDHYLQPEVTQLPDTGSDSSQTLLMWAAVLTLLGAAVFARSRHDRHI